MEPNPTDQLQPDTWNANDELFNMSILCRLEPRNEPASQVLAFNRHKTGRVVTLSTEHGAAVEMLQIGLQEPKQRRGLVMFGRYPGCSVEFPHPKVSLDHCYIDLNPTSGVLMVYNTSKNGTTWLDNHQLLKSSHRAMVPDYSKTLRVRHASFQIHWPKIANSDLPQYRSQILALACRLHADREIFDLTDLEHDLVSLPPTAPATRPASRHTTPFSELNDSQNPIKLEELGRGTYGIVWKAVERLTGNLIAVKQLHKNTNNCTLLEREISNMSKLRHENIVQLINWRQVDQHVELELEYCSLGSLSSIMSKAKAELGLLFTHIASGLEHIHNHNLIHRDIKPDNILVQQVDGQLCFKLADFGYSNTVNDAFTFCGSPLYMAPEVYVRERQTPQLDIYSLGVVFLEVLGCLQSIRRPRTQPPREGWQPIISKKAVGLNPGQSDSNFIRRMISRNALRRPTATECLEFLKGNAGQPSIETSPTVVNPSAIAALNAKAQPAREPEEPTHGERRSGHDRRLPRFQRTGFQTTGLVKNLILVPQRRLQQDQLGISPFASRKTQCLQADDLTQVDQILRAKRHQVSKFAKRVNAQPGAVTETGAFHPKVLRHQKKAQDGKIVKRNSEKGKDRNQIPGAWID